jgi:hypothetical protein
MKFIKVDEFLGKDGKCEDRSPRFRSSDILARNITESQGYKSIL